MEMSNHTGGTCIVQRILSKAIEFSRIRFQLILGHHEGQTASCF